MGRFGKTLDGELDSLKNMEGFFITDISPTSLIVFETPDESYLITVIDGERGEVVMQSTKALLEPTKCYLHGSTWGGSAIRLRWLGEGMYMEYRIENGRAHIAGPISNLEQKDDADLNQALLNNFKKGESS